MSTTFIIYPTTPAASLGRKARAAFMVGAFIHFLIAMILLLVIQGVFFTMGWAKILEDYVATIDKGALYTLGAVLVVGFVATRVARLATSKPAQYAAYLLFILLEGVLIVPLVSLAESHAPQFPACAATLTITGSLAIVWITMKFRENYRMWAAMGLWGGVALAAAAVCGFLFGLEPAVYVAAIAATLMGWSVLYDTSLMLDEYPRDRYIAAALELFAAAPLFPWYLLRAALMPRR